MNSIPLYNSWWGASFCTRSLTFPCTLVLDMRISKLLSYNLDSMLNYICNPCHSHFFNHPKGKSNVTFRGHMVLPSTKINLTHPLLRFLDHKNTNTHTHIPVRTSLKRSSGHCSQRTLPTQHKTITRGGHPCPRRDSKAQSQYLWYDMQFGWHPVATIQLTFTHKQYTEYKEQNLHNNTKLNIHINTKLSNVRSAGRAPSLRVIPWHLPYNWGKSTENPQLG
jgi:hypothetical protein